MGYPRFKTNRAYGWYPKLTRKGRFLYPNQ